MEFTIGAETHDVREIEYPLAPIRTEDRRQLAGIRVTRNGSLLFEGGFDPDLMDGMAWFDAGGKRAPQSAVRTYARGDSWSGYEPTAADAVRFALGPETSARGDPEPAEECLALERIGWAIFAAVIAGVFPGAAARIC